MDAEDCRRIVSLFEMSEHASRDDADEHTRNEAANAFTALLRLLRKYGLSLGDMPDIQRQHAQNKAAKTAGTAATAATANAAAAAGSDPNVLELVQHVLRSYIDVEPHEYIGVALWIIYTHVFSRFQVSPRLAALSPVRGCGKSKLLLIAERLAASSERHDSITPASLFRLINFGTPTLLLDEGDNLGLKIDREMRKVLNSGWLAGGRATRTIRGQPTEFSTFTPIAIAAIGTLTLPLLQRSIVIAMHRTLRTDLKTIEMLKLPEEVARLESLRRLIVAWAQGVAQFDIDPPLPKVLRNRTADNWRVLLAIADSFGSAYWSKAARQAAETFAGGYHDEDACVALLYDIRTIFRRNKVDRIKSSALTAALCEMEDGVGIWSAWRGENDDQSPHLITQGQIATLLRRFDRSNLRPRPLFELGHRKTGSKAGRGYYASQFERWWARYCPEDGGDAEILHLRAQSAKS